ncbi:porin [Rodentibacter myodis]|uniref:Porin n=1 Tax=Rodentibacter myodis TaxID=1907939 RepID=A0A1V3JLA2_9PAST|nr:porin [Rodentibacter myodis]OOF57434.1 porin [Rodentibacter myodis]
MKKTLLALTVAAFAAGSAQAYTYNIEETGTEINFSGSARLKWENINRKTEDADTTKNISHGDIDNNSSRFGFKIKQNLGNDFYAVGRVEWRFRGTDARGNSDEPNLASNRHNNFGHIYTRQLYAGFGHKTYGELVYGNMTTFTDEIKQTDLPNTYSLSDGLLNNNARRVIQYTNRGGFIPNLKFGAFYGATSPRNTEGLSFESLGQADRSHVWGAGAVYKYNIDDLQDWTMAAGFSRETFNNGRQVTAYSLGNAYRFDHTTLGLDLEHKNTEHTATTRFANNNLKREQYEARAVVFQELSEDWNAYAMYAYRHNKLKNATVSTATQKNSEVMIGTEYYVYKNGSFKVKPFVEGKVVRVKNLNNVADVKQRDYAAVVGLRAYW